MEDETCHFFLVISNDLLWHNEKHKRLNAPPNSMGQSYALKSRNRHFRSNAAKHIISVFVLKMTDTINPGSRTMPSFFAKVLLIALFAVLSHADFFVIPVNPKLGNVVTVATSGAQFTDIQAAIDSVSAQATAENPYVVFVGPGTYTLPADEQIIMADHVSLIGSGPKSTIIVGDISYGNFNSPNSAVVVGADATLGQLSVVNESHTVQRNVATGIHTETPTIIRNVSAYAAGGLNTSFGIFVYGANAYLSDINATGNGSGGYNGEGMNIKESNATLLHANLDGYGGSSANVGLRLEHSDASAIRDVTGRAEDAGSYGLYVYYGSPVIMHSYFQGATQAVKNNFGTATFRFSVFDNLITGSNTCFYCTDASHALTSDCVVEGI